MNGINPQYGRVIYSGFSLIASILWETGLFLNPDMQAVINVITMFVVYFAEFFNDYVWHPFAFLKHQFPNKFVADTVIIQNGIEKKPNSQRTYRSHFRHGWYSSPILGSY